MKYEIVNLETWERGNLFRFFIENMRNVMSMTVDIDVTALIEFVHAHGLKFYPTMMWVVSKAINQREEDRIRRKCFRNVPSDRMLANLYNALCPSAVGKVQEF